MEENTCYICLEVVDPNTFPEVVRPCQCNMFVHKTCLEKKLVRSAFKNYINVNTIDKINKINRPLLGSTWNIKDVDVLQKCVLKADKYFAKGIFKRFTKKHNDWNIVKTFTI